MHARLILFTAAMMAVSAPAQVEYDKLPPATADDLEHGRKLYAGQCAGCHGTTGGGGRGAILARPKLQYAADDRMLFRTIRRGIVGTEMPGAGMMSDKEIWQVASYVRQLGQTPVEAPRGDAQRGRAAYAKANCGACHMIRGEGGRLGPDLSDMGGKRSLAHLRTSLLDPAADTTDDFHYLRLTGPDGRTITGVRMAEDTFSLQVMDSSEKIHSFWKTELKDRSPAPLKTPMPSYKGALSNSEIEDLVTYLSTLESVMTGAAR